MIRTKVPNRRVAALRQFALAITAFTIAGAFVLGFEDSWAQPVAALLTAYALDLVLEALDAWGTSRRPRFAGGPSALLQFLLPAHITALSISLLLYPNKRLVPVAFATAVAIGSKYVFRVRVNGGKRHFLNPSNFGLATTFLLFPWIGLIPPYHFTENLRGIWYWVVPLAILAAGTVLHVRLTRKWPLVLGWVGGFVAQAALRSTVFGTPFIAPLVPLTGLGFWLFTNYMITDPATTPVIPIRQVAFGAATAALYGILVTAHVVFGFFFALVIVCSLRGASLYLRSRVPVREPMVEHRALEPAKL
jgi:hypothetical protein